MKAEEMMNKMRESNNWLSMSTDQMEMICDLFAEDRTPEQS